MKIKIDAGLLAEMVSTVSQAISGKPIRAEYECAYIRVAESNGSPIMTTIGKDAGLAIMRATDKIESLEDGEALIPAKTLLAFAKLMDGEVTLDVDDRFKCTLKCGGKKTAITCMDPELFSPDFTEIPNERTAKMDGDAFEKGVNSVLHCVATETGRMILTGVNLSFDGEKGVCEMTGMDNYRLAIATKPAECNETFNVTLPATYAKLIAKIIHEGKDVSFRFGKGIVSVEDYDTSIEATLLAGEYMDIKRITVRNGKMQAKVNASDFIDAIKVARIAADSNKSLVKLNFEKDEGMRVTANSDASEAVTEVYCDRIGEMDAGAKEIAFNGKYVEEALRASMEYGGEANLLMNTVISPMVILPVGRDDYYQLVLPVRRMA